MPHGEARPVNAVVGPSHAYIVGPTRRHLPITSLQVGIKCLAHMATRKVHELQYCHMIHDSDDMEPQVSHTVTPGLCRRASLHLPEENIAKHPSANMVLKGREVSG